MHLTVLSLTALSLIALVCLAVLWMRRRSHTDSFGYQGRRYSIAAEASDGVLVVIFTWAGWPGKGDGFWLSTKGWLAADRAVHDLSGLEHDEGRRLGRFGTGAYEFDDRPGFGVRAVWLPLWLPMLVTLVLPGLWLLRRLS